MSQIDPHSVKLREPRKTCDTQPFLYYIRKMDMLVAFVYRNQYSPANPLPPLQEPESAAFFEAAPLSMRTSKG